MIQNSKIARLLLVEDDEDDILLTKRALKKGRIVVDLDVVRNGQEALEYLRKPNQYQDALRPDVILLDLNMPVMSGHETLRQIRSDDNLCDIPVIILSTSSAEKDIV